MGTLTAIGDALAHASLVAVRFIWWLANSNFSLALLGAFAGAAGAQAIAARSERRRLWLREINDTGRALSLLYSVTNGYLTMKGQHVAALKEAYDKQCQAHTSACVQANTAQQPLLFDFQADLRVLGSVFTPIEALRTLVIDKIGSHRAAIFMVELIQAVQGAELAIKQRNELVTSWKGLSGEILALMYFGVPNAAGNTDTRYRDLVDAIANQVDDGIYFSLTLAEILRQYGERFRRRFGKEAPAFPIADFTNCKYAQLIPNPEKYVGYEKQLKVWAEMDAKANGRGR